MAEKRRGLGRGLGALIPDNVKNEDTGRSEPVAKGNTGPKDPSTTSQSDIVKKTAGSASSSKQGTVKKAPQQKRTAAKKTLDTPQTQQKTGEETSSPMLPVDMNENAPAERSKQKTQNVSRETKQTRKGKISVKDGQKKRADMGSALRNTTSTRRPVDFFFGEDDTPTADTLVPVPGAEFAVIKISDIHPNRKQPRTEFDEQEMEELAHSIREIGVLQPIVIRPSNENGKEKYELVMGERRWRASQRAGIDTIPAIIRETQDIDLLRDALLENLHRSQLNPIEEAAAYQQLLEEFGTTQEQLAQRIGRSRPQISNTIRLLKLPALVQRRVAAGVLSSGHARALLTMKSQAEMEKIAQKVVKEGLSVRAVEELVAASTEIPQKEKKTPQPQKHHERLDYVADAFADKLDTNVKIQLGARKGKMTIEFASVEDLNRIISLLDPNIEE